ncbi:MAG: cation:proton antiporter [Candidatus Muirbacterium halophilum]|nr:cation:proton antiporter [Candidatus Muirbacterium halophilum]MCK9474412.1 cation:proton antiporter [Candidatus Muirbacterium halophilum]
MIYGIAEIILLGFIIDWILTKFKIPGLTGMLVAGTIIGPYYLNIISPEINIVSTDLRLFALIVILLRAGLKLSWKALSTVGKRALLISFIPCSMEILFVIFSAKFFLGLSYMESAILGTVLGAVSPAVVVPFMIKFIKEGKGTDKNIPTLVLAGASIDDTIAIVLCAAFTKIYTGNSINIFKELSHIPISIISGIIAGLILGIILYRLFDKISPRNTKKTILLLIISIFLLHYEKIISQLIPFSALLAIMGVGFIILEKREDYAHNISSKLGKLWIPAHILLFILIGAEVNPKIALNTGLLGIFVILIGLLGRSIGVIICLYKSNLNFKERLFCIIAYIPKATVQAAIGVIPLAAMKSAGMNTFPGEIILSIAVLSILLTAPAGSFLIEYAGKRFLSK